MARKISLPDREYWTPPQAAKVLGRSDVFWRKALDMFCVKGYTSKMPDGRNYRWIHAGSARQYLERLK